MSIRKAIYDLLNDSESDVYPLIAPQETSDPFVVYKARRDHTRTQEGIATKYISLTLDIYANDFSDCVDLADTMSAALEDASGTYDTETLHVCTWISEDGDYIPGEDKFNITQEYLLRFT